MNHGQFLLTLALAMSTATLAVAGQAQRDAGGDRDNSRGEGGEADCVVSMVTPYYIPGEPGEAGDMLGEIDLTSDGSEAAISTYASHFLPDPKAVEGHMRRIIVVNRETQVGELISVAANAEPGNLGADDHCERYVGISPNGRYVAFISRATNLIKEPIVSGEHLQVFVRDRQEGVTYLASRGMEGEEGNNWSGLYRARVSDDGKVAFASRATNLTWDAPEEMWQVYVHDVHTGVTELVSRHNNGNASPQDATYPDISGDGNVVSFQTRAHLVEGLNNDTWNIYVRDLAAGATEIVSLADDDTDRLGWGDFSFLSYDGNRVAFRFGTNNWLDPTMPKTHLDCIYVRDRAARTTTGINRTWDDSSGASIAPEFGFTISDSGEHVAWAGFEDFITPDEVMETWHIYRTNVDTLEVELITRDAYCDALPEQVVDGADTWSAISGDGHHVAFITFADVMLDTIEFEHDWDFHLYMWSDGSTPSGPVGDLTGDGIVNVFDLLELLGSWGECENPDDPDACPADLTGDGTVNVFDLLELLGNWG